MPRFVWVEDYKSKLKPQTQPWGGGDQRREGPQLKTNEPLSSQWDFCYCFLKPAVPAGHFTRSYGFWNIQRAEALPRVVHMCVLCKSFNKTWGPEEVLFFKQASVSPPIKEVSVLKSNRSVASTIIFLQNREPSQNDRGIRSEKSD